MKKTQIFSIYSWCCETIDGHILHWMYYYFYLLWFFLFLFDIIFLYYYFLSILTLFLWPLHSTHRLFIYFYTWYNESINNWCWYMVYREDFFHTYFFYDFTIIFYLSTFFLHPLLGSTHPSGANCQTLREQSCSIPNCNGWTKTKKIPQTYNSDNSSATGSWKRND